MKRWAFCYFIVISCVFLPTQADAATLYMDPHETEIFPGDTISVEVRIDTDDGECINVIDGVINYDPQILPVDISRGESIVPIWVEEPQIDKNNSRITFAGGIPNGYCGRIDGDPRLTNMVFEILFQAPAFSVNVSNNDDKAEVNFGESTQVLLNDGTGAQAQLRVFGSEILVGDKPRNEPINEWNGRVEDDDIPPREFSITLSKDKSIYNGQYFISFNTTDKQSGLDHYEIMEEPLDKFQLFLWGAVGAPWETARSPYLLEDQSLNRTIRVKAVDKAGNEYIAVFVPPPEMRGATDRDYVRIGLFVAGALVLLVTFGSVLLYRWRLKNTEESEIEIEETYD